ncbi:MAG: NYN domain-containing protein [Phycisphaerales bacterium JB043]
MVLIDTFNVLHVTGVLPPELAGLDIAGLARLVSGSRWRDRPVVLVCDGTGGGRVRSRTFVRPLDGHPHIGALFVGPGKDADGEIERRLERDSSPRRILVVSSDNRLRASARRRRAEWMSSEAFLGALAADASRGGGLASGKPESGALDDDEIRAWMREFEFDDTLVERGTSECDRAGEAGEEWPDGVDPDDLDMQRWLDEMDNTGPPGSRS